MCAVRPLKVTPGRTHTGRPGTRGELPHRRRELPVESQPTMRSITSGTIAQPDPPMPADDQQRTEQRSDGQDHDQPGDYSHQRQKDREPRHLPTIRPKCPEALSGRGWVEHRPRSNSESPRQTGRYPGYPGCYLLSAELWGLAVRVRSSLAYGGVCLLLPSDGKPQTSRNSSSFVHTRSGSEASFTSRSYSLPERGAHSPGRLPIRERR
jgi:hypothetical protein